MEAALRWEDVCVLLLLDMLVTLGDAFGIGRYKELCCMSYVYVSTSSAKNAADSRQATVQQGDGDIDSVCF